MAMKRIFKFFKYVFLGILSLVALFLLVIFIGHKFLYPIPYSVSQSLPDLKEDGICLGVGCQPQAKSPEEFLPIFARQIKTYNQLADTIWPNNQAVNMYAAVQSIESSKSWLISPDGEFKELSKAELAELSPLRPKYDIGFAPFENDTMKGVYLALSEKSLSNYLEFEKYQYLGTYDMFITYAHEMFHILEQDQSWTHPDKIVNQGRSPKLDNTEARIWRAHLIQQLLYANAATDAVDKDQRIREALATYQHYKTDFPDDAEAGKYFDRIEGAAHYYDMITSLYSAYPDMINSKETLEKALRLLAKSNYQGAYSSPGVDNESYVIGAWAGFLLDQLSENHTDWKNELIQNPDKTPMVLLADYYSGKSLPEVVQPGEDFRNHILESIEAVKSKKVAPGIFRMLYQLVF